MSALIELFRLLYPFLLEFGIKEVNVKAFIAQNKTLSYLMMICILLFIMLVYALEQAHLRMLYRVVLIQEQIVLQSEISTCNNKVEQLELRCIGSSAIVLPDKPDPLSIEESLNELSGTNNEH